jgi:hypothetical protein
VLRYQIDAARCGLIAARHSKRVRNVEPSSQLFSSPLPRCGSYSPVVLPRAPRFGKFDMSKYFFGKFFFPIVWMRVVLIPRAQFSLPGMASGARPGSFIEARGRVGRERPPQPHRACKRRNAGYHLPRPAAHPRLSAYRRERGRGDDQ